MRSMFYLSFFAVVVWYCDSARSDGDFTFTGATGEDAATTAYTEATVETDTDESGPDEDSGQFNGPPEDIVTPDSNASLPGVYAYASSNAETIFDDANDVIGAGAFGGGSVSTTLYARAVSTTILPLEVNGSAQQLGSAQDNNASGPYTLEAKHVIYFDPPDVSTGHEADVRSHSATVSCYGKAISMRYVPADHEWEWSADDLNPSTGTIPATVTGTMTNTYTHNNVSANTDLPYHCTVDHDLDVNTDHGGGLTRHVVSSDLVSELTLEIQ